MSPLPTHVEGLDEIGQNIGKHPKSLGVSELQALGHTKTPLLRVVRKNCLDCAGSQGEVRRCSVVRCPFWPYRMGSNPFYGTDAVDETQEEEP